MANLGNFKRCDLKWGRKSSSGSILHLLLKSGHSWRMELLQQSKLPVRIPSWSVSPRFPTCWTNTSRVKFCCVHVFTNLFSHKSNGLVNPKLLVLFAASKNIAIVHMVTSPVPHLALCLGWPITRKGKHFLKKKVVDVEYNMFLSQNRMEMHQYVKLSVKNVNYCTYRR